MNKKLIQRSAILLVLLALIAGSFLSRSAAAAGPSLGNEFVKRSGPELRLHGKEYHFAGANNYYLMYKSQFMVDDVLNDAAESGFKVLRIWGSLDIGNQDGSNSIRGKADGVYFQYWDGTAPAYNDGPDGLQHLDYVVYKAGLLGLKLVIPFVNNWNDFGGMDQYVRWRDGQYHDDFYTDPLIRTWYQNWISHLLNRVNIYNGLKYKDDPTIMTWELANEPRCLSAGAYPRSDHCTTQTLIEWADTMSRYVKGVDNKHLVSVGDEGFYCIPGAVDWTENCGEGVDTLAFTSLPAVDVMSFHLYPDHWGKDVTWSADWIARHFQDARALDKPAMLGEFGLQDKSLRNPVFQWWTDTVLENRGSGALYWILSGMQDGGTLYPDYDGFTVYCPSPVCTTMSNFAAMMAAGQPLVFPPVADDDTAVTDFDIPVTLSPLDNDITYDDASLIPGTIDLDPLTDGQQTVVSVYGGTYALQPDGSLLFTPTAGFSGKAQAAYTVQDSLGQTSNTAALTVTVLPNPSAPVILFSFETGTEGWGPANWNPGAGTVSQTAAFHTDGNYGLQLDVNTGHWFGLVYATPLDLNGRTHLKVDLQTLAAGTSANFAIQVGDGWEWCQGTAWPWTNPNSTVTIDVDLISAFSCGTTDFSQVHSLYLFLNPGTFYIDAVRVE